MMVPIAPRLFTHHHHRADRESRSLRTTSFPSQHSLSGRSPSTIPHRVTTRIPGQEGAGRSGADRPQHGVHRLLDQRVVERAVAEQGAIVDRRGNRVEDEIEVDAGLISCRARAEVSAAAVESRRGSNTALRKWRCNSGSAARSATSAGSTRCSEVSRNAPTTARNAAVRSARRSPVSGVGSVPSTSATTSTTGCRFEGQRL